MADNYYNEDETLEIPGSDMVPVSPPDQDNSQPSNHRTAQLQLLLFALALTPGIPREINVKAGEALMLLNLHVHLRKIEQANSFRNQLNEICGFHASFNRFEQMLGQQAMSPEYRIYYFSRDVIRVGMFVASGWFDRFLQILSNPPTTTTFTEIWRYSNRVNEAVLQNAQQLASVGKYQEAIDKLKSRRDEESIFLSIMCRIQQQFNEAATEYRGDIDNLKLKLQGAFNDIGYVYNQFGNKPEFQKYIAWLILRRACCRLLFGDIDHAIADLERVAKGESEYCYDAAKYLVHYYLMNRQLITAMDWVRYTKPQTYSALLGFTAKKSPPYLARELAKFLPVFQEFDAMRTQSELFVPDSGRSIALNGSGIVANILWNTTVISTELVPIVIDYALSSFASSVFPLTEQQTTGEEQDVFTKLLNSITKQLASSNGNELATVIHYDKLKEALQDKPENAYRFSITEIEIPDSRLTDFYNEFGRLKKSWQRSSENIRVSIKKLANILSDLKLDTDNRGDLRLLIELTSNIIFFAFDEMLLLPPGKLKQYQSMVRHLKSITPYFSNRAFPNRKYNFRDFLTLLMEFPNIKNRNIKDEIWLLSQYLYPDLGQLTKENIQRSIMKIYSSEYPPRLSLEIFLQNKARQAHHLPQFERLILGMVANLLALTTVAAQNEWFNMAKFSFNVRPPFIHFSFSALKLRKSIEKFDWLAFVLHQYRFNELNLMTKLRLLEKFKQSAARNYIDLCHDIRNILRTMVDALPALPKPLDGLEKVFTLLQDNDFSEPSADALLSYYIKSTVPTVLSCLKHNVIKSHDCLLSEADKRLLSEFNNYALNKNAIRQALSEGANPNKAIIHVTTTAINTAIFWSEVQKTYRKLKHFTHIAIERLDSDVLILLYRYGADFSLKNEKDLTPIQHMLFYHADRMVEAEVRDKVINIIQRLKNDGYCCNEDIDTLLSCVQSSRSRNALFSRLSFMALGRRNSDNNSVSMRDKIPNEIIAVLRTIAAEPSVPHEVQQMSLR